MDQLATALQDLDCLVRWDASQAALWVTDDEGSQFFVAVTYAADAIWKGPDAGPPGPE
jgi:hypothetical protein